MVISLHPCIFNDYQNEQKGEYMLEDEVHMIAGVLAKYYSLRLRAKGMIHYLMHALYLHGISISVEYTQLSLCIRIIHVCVCV